MARLRTTSTGIHTHTVTHTAQRRKTQHAMEGHMGVALGKRVNTRGCRRQEGVVTPGFHGVMGLACLKCSVDGNPLLRDKQERAWSL